MIEAGEDPRFIARRLVILASEDIGLADPTALTTAVAAAQAVAADRHAGGPAQPGPGGDRPVGGTEVERRHPGRRTRPAPTSGPGKIGTVPAAPARRALRRVEEARPRRRPTGTPTTRRTASPSSSTPPTWSPTPTYYRPTSLGAEAGVKERWERLRRIDPRCAREWDRQVGSAPMDTPTQLALAGAAALVCVVALVAGRPRGTPASRRAGRRAGLLRAQVERLGAAVETLAAEVDRARRTRPWTTSTSSPPWAGNPPRSSSAAPDAPSAPWPPSTGRGWPRPSRTSSSGRLPSSRAGRTCADGWSRRPSGPCRWVTACAARCRPSNRDRAAAESPGGPAALPPDAPARGARGRVGSTARPGPTRTPPDARRSGSWPGAAAGVYASTKARRAAEALTVDGLHDRFTGWFAGARVLHEELRAGASEKETELRERLALGPHGRWAGPDNVRRLTARAPDSTGSTALTEHHPTRAQREGTT